MLKRVFGGAPNNVLRPLRRIIKEHTDGFPLKEIVEAFKGSTKTFTFDEDELNHLLSYHYGQSHTFSVLSILYPTLDFRNKFHLDHIFAKSLFKRRELLKLGIPESDLDAYLEKVNAIGNLQLLERIPNIEKSNEQFGKWLFETYKSEQEQTDHMSKHYIPNVSLTMQDFPVFIEKREQMLVDEFKKILRVD